MDAYLHFPEIVGAYWYWCEKRQRFRICDVIEKDGEMRAKFTDGSFQRLCDKKKALAVLIGLLCLPLIIVAGLLAMPMQGIFCFLGVKDQYMAVCHAAGDNIRDKIEAILKAEKQRGMRRDCT